MLTRITTIFIMLGLSISLMSGCFRPPFDHYHQPRRQFCANLDHHKEYQVKRQHNDMATGWGYSYSRISHLPMDDKRYLTRMLQLNNIQVIQYRDLITLIVPIDEYYLLNSSKLNDVRFDGLNFIADYISLFSCTTIYVAAFSDNVGDPYDAEKLSNARAESMLGFLWANGIPSAKLNPQGFGVKFPIADNKTIRGSAMNRRIEIQWTTSPDDTLNNAISYSK
jgi:outer membrane protein OmpA-like peptidoglycan-associated protein